MHEASIASELLEVLEEQARQNGLARITKCMLTVGALRMVVPELLATAFEVISRGSVAEGASLQIERVALVARCGPCEREVALEDFVFVCPTCGNPLEEIISGQDLVLMEVHGEGDPDA